MSWAPRPRGSPAALSLWGRGLGGFRRRCQIETPRYRPAAARDKSAPDRSLVLGRIKLCAYPSFVDSRSMNGVLGGARGCY
jgi:hypothetical protein